MSINKGHASSKANAKRIKHFDNKIRQLTINIDRFSIAKSEKEAQLKLLLRKQRESKREPKSTILRDQAGVIIRKGDWVKATLIGKFDRSEDTVVHLKKWVTFEDHTGVKQVRAPNNILISNDGRERPRNTSSARRGNKSQSPTEK